MRGPTVLWSCSGKAHKEGPTKWTVKEFTDDRTTRRRAGVLTRSIMARPSTINSVSLAARRAMSTAIVDEDPHIEPSDFTESFLNVVKDDLPLATCPAKSSALLRRLVQSELLRFTDMRDNPEKFFLAHRLLSSVGLNGFGVRFTVQFNLFAGSILGLGGSEQEHCSTNISAMEIWLPL